MNSDENGYCRLCAELKRNDKFLNLYQDEGAHEEISKKLRRLNSTVDFSADILPRTVCFVCVTTLDSAFQFVLNVQRAQATLSTVLLGKQIKEEILDSINTGFSDDENDSFSPPEVPDDFKDVKQEAEDVKPTKKMLKKLSRSKVKREKKKQKSGSDTNKDVDSIPLSLLKLTWKDYSWICSYCETQFATVEELKSHSIQFHDCCNPYRCTDCRIRKLSLDKFVQHVKRHRKYLKYSCLICSAKFSSLSEARSHKSEHLKAEFSCDGCNTSFRNSTELEKHTSSYYKSMKSRHIFPLMQHTEDLTCLLCKKTFKSRSSLQTHLLTHTERKRDHTCEICGKCFLNKQNLAGHMVLHDNTRPFQCEICKAAFKTYPLLRNHIGIHDNKKPFACEQCGRCFRLQKQLQSHSIIHTDVMPHVCSYCNKGFRFKTILNQHVRQHTGVKPYSCPICSRDFTNWPNYNKHMKRRHGMDMAKKKHTPEGVFPIDPVTGEVVILPKTEQIMEWKRQVLQHKRPGRPKFNQDNTGIGTNTLIADDIGNISTNELLTHDVQMAQQQQGPTLSDQQLGIGSTTMDVTH